MTMMGKQTRKSRRIEVLVVPWLQSTTSIQDMDACVFFFILSPMDTTSIIILIIIKCIVLNTLCCSRLGDFYFCHLFLEFDKADFAQTGPLQQRTNTGSVQSLLLILCALGIS